MGSLSNILAIPQGLPEVLPYDPGRRPWEYPVSRPSLVVRSHLSSDTPVVLTLLMEWLCGFYIRFGTRVDHGWGWETFGRVSPLGHSIPSELLPPSGLVDSPPSETPSLTCGLLSLKETFASFFPNSTPLCSFSLGHMAQCLHEFSGLLTRIPSEASQWEE